MSCHGRAQITTEKESNMKEQAELYLAGGCFWGTEHFLKQINGVLHTEVGYANGHGQNPSYEEVCTDQTGFAETVHVIYNPQILPISLLLQLYFRTIDPTSLNKQGGDVGTQYRTGIYYTDAHNFPLIQAEMAKLGTQYTKKLQIEVQPLRNFYAAEGYHQDYLDKNPSGYCHVPQTLMAYARVANKDTTESSRYVKKTDARELFYHTWEKSGSTHYYEVDFLISEGSKVNAFEIKSSGSGKHESIKVFDKKFSKNVHDIYLLSQKDVGKEENLLLKPFYLMPFLIEQEYVRNDKI